MTAQVVIMNRHAAAIASDSSVTVNGEGQQRRTFDGARKVYPLAMPHRVAVLHSGNVELNSVPFDVLIAEWISELGDKPLSTTRAYLEDLVDWLPRQRVFDAEWQWVEFRRQLKDLLLDIRGYLLRNLSEAGISEDRFGSPEAVALSDPAAAEWLRTLKTWDFLEGHDVEAAQAYITKHREAISELVDWVFDDTPRSASMQSLLDEFVLEFAQRWNWVARDDSAVLAIVGYGDEELMPSSQGVTVNAVWNERLRYQVWEPSEISVDNGSIIQPLGLSEAMWTFFGGYHSSFADAASDRLRAFRDELFGDVSDEPDFADQLETQTAEAVDALRTDFERLSRQQFIDPLTNTVAAMPASHLAGVAEAFVGLQVLRQKTQAEMETVGGHIDVALISRAHGFTWVRQQAVA